jgi:CRP/FNR family cyclic AMP-dependent transcriptional regulator
MEDLHRLLEQHEFLKGLSTEQAHVLVSCVKNVRFREGEFLLREGQAADVFYLLRVGRVALEVNVPGRGPLQMENLGPNDMLGLSWLVPPGREQVDARALEPVVALAFDGACLRGKMDGDPALGYALARRILAETYKRLERVRLARVDVYKVA